MNDSVSRLISLIHRSRLDLSCEKKLQSDLAEILATAGVKFEREKRLSTRDIPDFFVEGGIVLECKMHRKARKVEVFKQMKRYASHVEVLAVVLVSNIAMGLPSEIENKPIFSASLSRGWL